MDIDLHIDREHPNHVATFHYHRNPDAAIIKINSHTCPGCGNDMLDEDDYLNILNHELFEITAIKTLLEDHINYIWDKEWWDDRIEYFVGHMAWHEHGDLLYTLYYG